MRPTYLKFRSPKEKTGEYCIPATTYQGTTLNYYKIQPKNKSTFPRSQRFEHIAEVSRRTSYRVGPGAYNFRLSTNKLTGPKFVKENIVTGSRKFEYFYVGDSIVRQERPESRGSRSLSNSRNNQSFTHGTMGRHGLYREDSLEKRERNYESSRRPHSSQEQRLDYDPDSSGHKKKPVKDFYNYSGVKTKPMTSHLDELGMYGSKDEVRRSLEKGGQRPASVQKMRGGEDPRNPGNNDIRKEIINKVFVTYDKH